jgi:hypothetical protein
MNPENGPKEEPKQEGGEEAGVENEVANPNSIGEVLDMRGPIETKPDSVYRSLRGKAAVDDIFASGVVRNRQTAGLVEKSRWGERVFWSRGKEGAGLNVGRGDHVIVAPHEVASVRAVTKDDLEAIYTRSESDGIVDILPAERARIEQAKADGEQERLARIEQLKRELGTPE